MVALSDATSSGRRIVGAFSEKNVPLMAAGIAYNAFVSLAPALLILVLVVSAFGGGLEDRLLVIARRSLPGPIADTVVQVLDDGSTAAGASVVGLVVLLWGSLKVFRGLDTAFSEIYGTESTDSFADKLRDGAVVLVALVATGLTTVGLSAVFASLFEAIPLVGLLTPVVTVLVLVVALFPMFYFFPDVDFGWREVVPGVVFAAVAWAVLQSVFQVYLAFKSGGTGSFFGGVIVVVTWLYFSGLVLLLGAVVNAELGGYLSTDRASADHASSAADGGTDATTERRASLDRVELAAFLRGLHDDLTERRGTVAGDDVNRYGRPEGEVELVERSASRGEERERTVELKWTTSDGRDRSSGDD